MSKHAEIILSYLSTSQWEIIKWSDYGFCGQWSGYEIFSYQSFVVVALYISVESESSQQFTSKFCFDNNSGNGGLLVQSRRSSSSSARRVGLSRIGEPPSGRKIPKLEELYDVSCRAFRRTVDFVRRSGVVQPTPQVELRNLLSVRRRRRRRCCCRPNKKHLS